MKKNNEPIITIPPGLAQVLLTKYPDLSPTELKISSLLSFNLSSKTIAEIRGRNIRTIEYTRYNIRKKMKLSLEESLVNHIILILHEKKEFGLNGSN